MVDDFFWEVLFILNSVLFHILKTVVMCVCVFVFNPGVLVEVDPHPKLLPFWISYVSIEIKRQWLI